MCFWKRKKQPITPEVIYQLKDIPRKIINFSNVKPKIDIAIIDDSPFSPSRILKNNEFNLHELGDINNLSCLNRYPIVVCDIQGVGKHFSTPEYKYGGAVLITEIRKKYPNKYIIAYSTDANDLTLQQHTKNADRVMPVAANIEQWTEALDQAIRAVTDPILQWKKVRSYLLDNDIELEQVFQLEQLYIKSLLEKVSPSQSEEEISKLKMDDLFKDIATQFISSGAIEVIKNLIES